MTENRDDSSNMSKVSAFVWGAHKNKALSLFANVNAELVASAASACID